MSGATTKEDTGKVFENVEISCTSRKNHKDRSWLPSQRRSEVNEALELAIRMELQVGIENLTSNVMEQGIDTKYIRVPRMH